MLLLYQLLVSNLFYLAVTVAGTVTMFTAHARALHLVVYAGVDLNVNLAIFLSRWVYERECIFHLAHIISINPAL